MKAIGCIKEIRLDKLREYVLSRCDYKEIFDKEKKNTFERMYEEKIFPEFLSVHYDYGSGTYNVSYGNYKYENACRKIFNEFFELWNSDNSEYQNRRSLEILERFHKQYDYAIAYDQPLHYVYESGFGYYITCAEFNVFVPKQFVKATPYIDYSDTPLRLIAGNENMVQNLPSVGDETQRSLKSKLEDKKAEIEKKVQEIKDKEEEQKAEIEKMKLAIEEKYKDVFSVMESKKQELELMMQQLEGQLFVLDTQIYGIRCFFGETVHFTQISSGRNEPVEAPVVMYQKIRFLDEELAKYAALYDVDGDDTSLFEELLRNRQDMRDLFLPEGKSLSLIRISKDVVHYKSGQNISASESGKIDIYNVMKEYEVYHGNQIAILVRNGENCYIGWTEMERISISDENAFLTPKEATVVEETEVKKDWSGNIIEENTNKNEIAARFFVFSIAQGLIENSKLLELPEGVAVTQNSPYIVFSMADSWLEDSTYGSYDDIMQKCSVNVRKGDTILTLCNLSAEGRIFETYSNDRGRGYRNRTHDVHVKDNTLYQINLVEDDDRDNQIVYEYRKKGNAEWVISSWSTSYGKDNWKEDFDKRHVMDDYEYRGFKFLGKVKHVFVSLFKEDTWTDSSARANFELYSNEYMNLTFLNTVYIKYIITNRKLPNKFFRGSINFSYLLPYMNKAMEYLKQREEKEESLISKYTKLLPNWQIALTDWKIQNNVHEMTEYQAKRFAKWYRD